MTSWLVVSLLLSLAPFPALRPQAPRDTPPPVIENARRERELRAAIAAGTATVEIYMEMAALMNRQNRFDATIEALRGAAALEPSNPEPQHRIAVFFWDKARGDAADPAAKRLYIQQGLEAEDRALAVQPDYMEAMTYKNILLRLQANASTDPIEQKRLIDEADALRKRVLELQRDRQAQNPDRPVKPAAAATVAFAGFLEPFDQAVARWQPARVGGNLRTPTKVKDVKPVYPASAQAARVQGVVVMEALIDDTGNVANARVLRSVPLLDDAALEAVSKWRFTPTELNGRPVAVLMTVTINFTLME